MKTDHYRKLQNYSNQMKTDHVIQGYKKRINLSGNELLRKSLINNLIAYINIRYPEFLNLINLYKT